VHYQLFKSDDEIRQDAIMEQVFGMTNNILKRDRQTKARRLNFRTYVVIPLANRSGILEFVAEGISIGDWLKPAHDRYRKPDEQKNSTIRETMYQMQGKRPEAELVRQWKLETTRFHPVMRHFFREKQPEPMAWFTMRTNYARSVAVTSMVGHMLGIGDRHLSNIMIDQVNGELIHIDFGIVFEEVRQFSIIDLRDLADTQGLNLRIPERVPFRLTRDMIDGLGIMGVDGTFRRCSEQTLRVLRASSPLIMTVLEVFKHDPLFAWMGDPSKLERAQGGGKLAVDPQAMAQDKADRVLGKIRAKLKDELGVEYTVNQLVLQATDPVNLGTIYFGACYSCRSTHIDADGVGWHSWF
jgi:ataxia telangiectasia mutated family protein